MQINGKELAVEIAGEGPAVLLVHGLGATTNFYQVQTDALVADHTSHPRRQRRRRPLGGL